jgi:hypothetical protein
MSERADAAQIAGAIGGREESGHVFRAPGSGELLAWAIVYKVPAASDGCELMICAGSPAHDWIVLLAARPDDELFAAAMAQAIVRSPLEKLRDGNVDVEPALWEATTPNNKLPFHYRMSPAPAEIRARYDHALVATGHGLPASLLGHIAVVTRCLDRLERLREIDGPESMIEADKKRATTHLQQLRSHADNEGILASFPASLHSLVAELLAKLP